LATPLPSTFVCLSKRLPSRDPRSHRVFCFGKSLAYASSKPKLIPFAERSHSSDCMQIHLIYHLLNPRPLPGAHLNLTIPTESLKPIHELPNLPTPIFLITPAKVGASIYPEIDSSSTVQILTPYNVNIPENLFTSILRRDALLLDKKQMTFALFADQIRLRPKEAFIAYISAIVMDIQLVETWRQGEFFCNSCQCGHLVFGNTMQGVCEYCSLSCKEARRNAGLADKKCPIGHSDTSPLCPAPKLLGLSLNAQILAGLADETGGFSSSPVSLVSSSGHNHISSERQRENSSFNPVNKSNSYPSSSRQSRTGVSGAAPSFETGRSREDHAVDYSQINSHNFLVAEPAWKTLIGYTSHQLSACLDKLDDLTNLEVDNFGKLEHFRQIGNKENPVNSHVSGKENPDPEEEFYISSDDENYLLRQADSRILKEHILKSQDDPNCKIDNRRNKHSEYEHPKQPQPRHDDNRRFCERPRQQSQERLSEDQREQLRDNQSTELPLYQQDQQLGSDLQSKDQPDKAPDSKKTSCQQESEQATHRNSKIYGRDGDDFEYGFGDGDRLQTRFERNSTSQTASEKAFQRVQAKVEQFLRGLEEAAKFQRLTFVVGWTGPNLAPPSSRTDGVHDHFENKEMLRPKEEFTCRKKSQAGSREETRTENSSANTSESGPDLELAAEREIDYAGRGSGGNGEQAKPRRRTEIPKSFNHPNLHSSTGTSVGGLKNRAIILDVLS
jgi:hypothetical protein